MKNYVGGDNKMLLYIIRHADPVYNPDSLTERGKIQAQALAKRLYKCGINKIYSSPCGRAAETAKATSCLTGINIQTADWTKEVYDELSVTLPCGKKKFAVNLDGTVFRSDENLMLGDKWYNAKELSTVNAKKVYDTICNNSDTFLQKLGYSRQNGVYKITASNDDKVAVFCHAGFITLWLAHLLNLSPAMLMAGIGIKHTGVTIIEFENSETGYTTPYCLCLSDTSHLYNI